MRILRTTILGIVLSLTMGVLPARAVIITMDLYNSFNLIDQNNVQLQGTTAAGDLVQVILAGANNSIQAPDVFGAPAPDDSLLFTTHVGVGVPSNPNQGLLDVLLTYDTTLAGQNVGNYFYVRFWNDASAGASTYYGDSALFQLPAGDFFNQSLLDFVPTGGSPHQTDHPFGALAVIPEPSNLFVFGLGFLAVGWLRRRGAFARAA